MGSKGHFYISLAKSIIRIGTLLVTVYYPSFAILAVGLCFAEALGIAEELADKR